MLHTTLRTVRSLSAFAAVVLLAAVCSGCLSGAINRSAGGELVWWCDRCKTQIGDPAQHVCGMTRYNSETGRDEPMEGISEEILEQARRERLLSRDPDAIERDPTLVEWEARTAPPPRRRGLFRRGE